MLACAVRQRLYITFYDIGSTGSAEGRQGVYWEHKNRLLGYPSNHSINFCTTQYEENNMNNIQSLPIHQQLYDYVKENIGINRIEFKTKVTKEEFNEYLKNYPSPYDFNTFMRYQDYYDFEKRKRDEPHWNYKIARYYFDSGADDYYLPTIGD